MKNMEIMSKLGKVIAKAALVGLVAIAFVVPVKADVISEAQSGYERGMAYLKSTQISPETSSVVAEAQSGYERGIA